jgi:hypothetical protein
MINKIFPLSHFLSAVAFPLNLVAGFEHFPWHLFRLKSYKTSALVFYLFVALVLIIFVFSENITLTSFLKYLIYLVASTIPFFYSFHDIERIRIIARSFFSIILFIGFLQLVGVMKILDPMMSLLITRFSGEEIGGYRGVTLLETEPARASYLLIMTYLIGFWNRFKVLNMSMLFIGIFVMTRSFSGMLLFTCFILIYYLSLRRITSLIIIIMLIYMAGSGFHFQYPDSKLALAIGVFTDIGFGDLLLYVSSVSGGRIQSVIDAFHNMRENSYFIFPYIQDGYVIQSLIPIDLYRGYGFTNTVPMSFILYHLRVLGLIGIITFIFSLLIKVYPFFWRVIFSKGFLIFIFIGVLYSPPGGTLLSLFLMVLVSNESYVKHPPRNSNQINLQKLRS